MAWEIQYLQIAKNTKLWTLGVRKAFSEEENKYVTGQLLLMLQKNKKDPEYLFVHRAP